MSKTTDAILFYIFIRVYGKSIVRFKYRKAMCAFLFSPIDFESKVKLTQMWEHRLQKKIIRRDLYIDLMFYLGFMGYMKMYWATGRLLYWLFAGNVFGVFGILDWRHMITMWSFWPDIKEDFVYEEYPAREYPNVPEIRFSDYGIYLAPDDPIHQYGRDGKGLGLEDPTVKMLMKKFFSDEIDPIF